MPIQPRCRQVATSLTGIGHEKDTDRRRSRPRLRDDLAHHGRPAPCRGRPVPPTARRAKELAAADLFAAVVTVARVAPAEFVETVLATGSLVAREEILVGPEVEGLRITEVLADEGQRVKKGDVLARLVADTLDAQVAQNDAALARTAAAIAQAKPPSCRPRRASPRAAMPTSAPSRCARAGHMTEARVRPARAGRPHGRGAAHRCPGRPARWPRPSGRRWRRSAAS